MSDVMDRAWSPPTGIITCNVQKAASKTREHLAVWYKEARKVPVVDEQVLLRGSFKDVEEAEIKAKVELARTRSTIERQIQSAEMRNDEDALGFVHCKIETMLDELHRISE